MDVVKDHRWYFLRRPYDKRGGCASGSVISRTPVREAFLRLAADGALVLLPKRGAAQPVTAEDVQDVMDARLLIEPWAVSITATGLGRDSCAICNSLLLALDEAGVGVEVLEYHEADRSFHEAIVTATGNRLIGSYCRSLRDCQIRMGVAALVDNKGRTYRRFR